MARTAEMSPSARPDIQLNPSTGETTKGKKSAKGLRAIGKFNTATGIGWGTAAVLTGGAALPVAMASLDGFQAFASFKAANAIDKNGQIEAKNGKYMQAETASATTAEATTAVQDTATNRRWLDSLQPWKPSQQETLHAHEGETVVYAKGNSRTRKIVGETMVWGGGIYGIWELAHLNVPGAVAGGVVHVAGRWVRPKE